LDGEFIGHREAAGEARSARRDRRHDSLDDLLAATITDSMSPVICMNDGCDYTVEMEPDQNVGCGTPRL
jgi:hypothetical protein